MLKRRLIHRRYGDLVYARDMEAGREFLFNETVGDVLDYLAARPDADTEDLAAHMQALYGAADMRGEAEACMRFLAQNGLLEAAAPESQEPETRVHERILEHCAKAHQLYAVALEVTYRCCERCIHCYIDDDAQAMRARELTTRELCAVLDELRAMGCASVLLTGGEVCLREDLAEIVRHAVGIGMIVDVYTTGVGMTDAQFDALCSLGINTVSFSLYGGTPEVHDAITRVPGSFQKTLERMMMFKCAGVSTYIKTIALRQNAHDLPNLYRLAKRLRMDVGLACLVSPTHGGASAEALRLNDAAGYRALLEMDWAADPYPMRKEARDLDGPVCGCGQYMLSIDPYGGIHPCVAMGVTLGNVRTDSLQQVWASSDVLERLRRVAFRDMACGVAECGHRDFCSVCMGSCYQEETGKVCPARENCALAEAMHGFAREKGAKVE